ncbi:hypothetical protein ES702_02300 [subsurface metagenome]
MIPKQYKNPDFRFCKLGKEWNKWLNRKTGEKAVFESPNTEMIEGLKADGWIALGKMPIEKDWTNKPYTLEQIKNYRNYGIICGFGGLAGLDDDTKDKRLIKLFNQSFKPTFQVHEHLYIICKDLPKKLIFFDKKGKHCGELQFTGTQLVACGSIHPTGKVYEVKNDVPILEVTYMKLKEVFKNYLPKEKVITEKIRANWEGDDIKDIPISSVISFAGLIDMGDGCYQGCHPKHDSVNGMNFRVNTSMNTWCCFRCSSGGSSPELIAVMEGIIDCSEAGSNCFTTEQAQEVIRVAREKYGLRTPETQNNLEPMGWAISIDIERMAERKGMLNCPKCNEPFSFDKCGRYYCSTCKYGGGLKKFAELCLQNKSIGVMQ